MNNITDSVYDLITNLCQRFTQDRTRIKKLRSIAFEIILGKKRYRIIKSKKIVIVVLFEIINVFIRKY